MAKTRRGNANNRGSVGPSFLGGLFLGSATSGSSSGGVYTQCDTDDDSLYCKMIRFRSIFSNIIYFIFMFAIFVYVIYYIVIPYFFKGKKGTGKKR